MTYTLDDVRKCPVWRHLKTASYYHVLGLARNSTNGAREGEVYVVYFSIAYQKLNVRLAPEFLDGRFVPVPAVVK